MNKLILIVSGLITLFQIDKYTNSSADQFSINLNELKGINSVPFYLTAPAISKHPPAAGKRTKLRLEKYEDSEIYHNR